jgi:hypothetical protein
VTTHLRCPKLKRVWTRGSSWTGIERVVEIVLLNEVCGEGAVGSVDDLAERLKREYAALADAVAAAIDRADPIGLLAAGAPRDEYSSEIGTILPGLKTAEGSGDVQTIIHEEFVRWFDTDIAGPLEAYHEAAIDIWHAWEDFRRRMPDVIQDVHRHNDRLRRCGGKMTNSIN